ncbi:MAG: DNA polymerase domain-containing protein, partial [Candidatus Bathyarchaeia archaeon]
SPPIPLANNSFTPDLRLLAFSMICYSREGAPKPDLNPVIVLSTVTNNGFEKQFVASQNKDDTTIIQEFMAYIRSFDPDIIVSYGANRTDWTYLRERSHKHGFLLNFDRASSEPHKGVYGHVSTTGIVNIDLADFSNMFPEVKVQNLANFAKNLGVTIERKRIIDETSFADFWDTPQKNAELLQYGLDNAHRVYGTIKLLIDFSIQLSILTLMPLDQVMSAATGFRVESYLIKQAQKIGEIVPRRLEQTYVPYTGGLVLLPKPGLHENIAVLDFKSMYPNIMITYNLSPDTYIQAGDPEPSEGVYVAPEIGYRFRKSPPGFYNEALTHLLNIRAAIRQKMKQQTTRTVEYQVLNARQKALKIITNAIYGYAGWIGARWYIKPVAEAASAWGRHIIWTSSQMAKNDGVEVIYGDTDSLFVKYDKTKNEKLQADIQQTLKLEVEISHIYVRVFFSEAKKRYAGLRQDGSLDIVGLEVIRGDWAEVAKRVQQHVLEIILKVQSPEKAIEYVKSIAIDLQHNRIPLEDLIIWKTLTKPPKNYAVRAPHVQAAKMLIERGARLTIGDKVGYVIQTGKGPLFSRAIPYVFAKIDNVDSTYYITNQVLPAAARVLKSFNITEKNLEAIIKEEKTKRLIDYF